MLGLCSLNKLPRSGGHSHNKSLAHVQKKNIMCWPTGTHWKPIFRMLDLLGPFRKYFQDFYSSGKLSLGFGPTWTIQTNDFIRTHWESYFQDFDLLWCCCNNDFRLLDLQAPLRQTFRKPFATQFSGLWAYLNK